MKNTTPLVTKAKEYAFPLIEQHCGQYYFHNLSHTKSVLERSSYLALNLGIAWDDLEDLQVASIFHDIGFIKQYPKNEYIGSQIARKWLEEEKHPEERIQKIESIIMATVLFSKPKNILEEIIQDADVDNIGTKNAFNYSQLLQKEILEFWGIEIPECSFWQFTYRMHSSFHFHTNLAKKERQWQQKRNVELLKSYLKMLECEVPQDIDHIEKII